MSATAYRVYMSCADGATAPTTVTGCDQLAPDGDAETRLEVAMCADLVREFVPWDDILARCPSLVEVGTGDAQSVSDPAACAADVAGVDAAATVMSSLNRSMAALLGSGARRTSFTEGAAANMAWAAGGQTLVRDLGAGAPSATVSADAQAWLDALVSRSKQLQLAATSPSTPVNACRP